MCNIWGLNVFAKQVDVLYWHVNSGFTIFFVTEMKLRSSVGPWIKDKYEGVCIFTSGLDVGFLGAGIAIIMNNSLACHVSKVEEVSGQVVAVWLLFKNKLSVSVIGLYVGASSGVCFGQAFEVNFLIAKTVNSSTFVVLGEDFNKNRSGRSASFRFCSSLGLVNSFSGNSRGVERTIDFIFVSENLVSAVAGHRVGLVLDFFDTNHNAIKVSVGLDGLLNVYLNSLRKQANKNCWKFNIKDADVTEWFCFRDCSSVMVLGIKDDFLAAAAEQDLDAMWFLLKKVLVDSADNIFSQHWFSEFQCSKNKQSSKFLGLELLIVKIVKKFGLTDTFGFDCLVKKWSILDADKAFMLMDMVQSGQKKVAILKFLSIIKKEYRKFKLYESKLVQEASIRKAIKKRMEKFCSDKGNMIRSVVLDHLFIDNELVLEPEKMVPSVLPDLWARQYASLAYVKNDAFSDVMSAITLDKLLLVVGSLPNGKAAGLSVLTNTCLITLIETTRKILSKILSDRISFVCSRFGILRGDNFSVLKDTSIQSPVFAVGSVTYDSVGWHYLRANLHHIKICGRFINFFGSIYEDRVNKVMTDFGLLNDYRGEVFSPLLWRIFYNSLLCKVKRHEHLCGYCINTKFVVRTDRIENSGGMSSFFATSAFVDDMIWIGNCQASIEFFYINNISINNEKTVAIPINQGVKIATLSISGRLISIARKGEAHRYLGIFLSTKELSKPSLVKAHSDVRFFVNKVLRKVITDKQFSYLVLAVLQSIVSYVKKDFRSKACLPHDFPNAALHHLSLYGLKSFKQVQSERKMASMVLFANTSGIFGCLFKHRFLDLQVLSWTPLNPFQYPVKLCVSPVNNFLVDVVKILMNIDFSLVNNLFNAFHYPGYFSMPSILEKFLYFDSVYSLKCFGCLDPWGLVPLWFTIASKYFLNQSFSSFHSSVASNMFSSVQNGLHEIWFGYFEAYMDGSLKGAGSADVSSGAAAYFPVLGLGVGVRVCGLLSSTMVELQTVALALECVSSSSSVVLYLNSQAAIDVCISEMLLEVLDFRNHCWVERKHVFNLIRNKDLSVNWIKVKDYAGVLGNMEADRFAEHFLVADDTVVLGNAHHFVRDVFRSICYACWEAGPGRNVVSANICKSANLHTYLMKALHKRLPVVVRKRLYNRCYPDVQYLLCREIELPDHVFTCSQDVHIWREILLEASMHWAFLVFDSCHLDIGRYLVLCKGFVMKVWCAEAVDVFDDVKKASCVVVDFVRFLVELVDIEKAGLVGDNGLVLGLFHCVSSVLSDGVVRMLDIAESFAISFGYLRPCLIFLVLDGRPHVNISV
ncbi:hypothetical protein G9A89_021891 [Geosiphon pyriformis]|nr:hypothetical protein G9A89_021891 [Geosiphon pyriformis]